MHNNEDNRSRSLGTPNDDHRSGESDGDVEDVFESPPQGRAASVNTTMGLRRHESQQDVRPHQERGRIQRTHTSRRRTVQNAATLQGEDEADAASQNSALQRLREGPVDHRAKRLKDENDRRILNHRKFEEEEIWHDAQERFQNDHPKFAYAPEDGIAEVGLGRVTREIIGAQRLTLPILNAQYPGVLDSEEWDQKLRNAGAVKTLRRGICEELGMAMTRAVAELRADHNQFKKLQFGTAKPGKLKSSPRN